MHASDLIITKPGGLADSRKRWHATCRSPCSTPFPVRRKITPTSCKRTIWACASQRRISPPSCPHSSSIKSVCAGVRESCRGVCHKSRANENIVALAVRLRKGICLRLTRTSHSPRIKACSTSAPPPSSCRTASCSSQKTTARSAPTSPAAASPCVKRPRTLPHARVKRRSWVSPSRRSAPCGLPKASSPRQAKSSVTASSAPASPSDAPGTDLITRGDRFDSPNEPSVHFASFRLKSCRISIKTGVFENRSSKPAGAYAVYYDWGLTHVHRSPSFHPTNAPRFLSSLTIDFSPHVSYNQDKKHRSEQEVIP